MTQNIERVINCMMNSYAETVYSTGELVLDANTNVTDEIDSRSTVTIITGNNPNCQPMWNRINDGLYHVILASELSTPQHAS
jgi:hypothetical protein